MASPKQGGRAVFDPAQALFKHHITLRQDDGAIQLEARHAIRFHLHDQAEAVCRDDLEIAGVIGGCEGVVPAAIAGDHAGEFTRVEVVCALEHQMLKEMGEASFARLLINRADFVVGEMGDRSTPMIFDNNELKAVIKHVSAWVKRPPLTAGDGRQAAADGQGGEAGVEYGASK